MTRTKANLLLLLAGAIWGMGFVAQSTAMASIGPLLFVCLRFTVATLVVAPFAFRELRMTKAGLRKGDMAGFLWIGLCLFAAMTLQQIGLLTTSVTNSGFLTGLYVVFVPVLVVVFLRRHPHPVVWPCAALAFAGIWLLSGSDLAKLNTGDVLTILCAVFWACQVLLIGVYAHRSNQPLLLSVIQFAVCAILSFLAALLLEPLAWPPIEEALPEILYTGLFSSGLAFTLQAIGQRYSTQAQAAVFLSSESLFAALFGAAFLGEKIAGLGYLGCLFIFTAILAVEIIPTVRNKNSG